MTKLKKLPDISEVQPISEKDELCLNEIRGILEKYNSINRFGITLLHEHFEINDDEVLIETCDTEKRILTITPVKSGFLKNRNYIETNWRLDVEGASTYCMVACIENDEGKHQKHWQA